MAYDRKLADRIRTVLSDHEGVVEKSMFGGLAFLVGGNMAVAASGQGGLLLRCNPGATAELCGSPGVDRAVMRERVMNGWLTVDDGAVADDADLARWVQVGTDYAESLPAKK
ncbi:TfoX/Sxy family protein [Sinomonas halotolerans]|uniref:TfoX/Sxy family protein n=1 Tax=Sinomonas halotolerans TaxID=1644133 RepID=A0ABU9X1S8_9MICC